MLRRGERGGSWSRFAEPMECDLKEGEREGTLDTEPRKLRTLASPCSMSLEVW